MIMHYIKLEELTTKSSEQFDRLKKCTGKDKFCFTSLSKECAWLGKNKCM